MDAETEIQEVPKELIQFINTGSKFIIAGHKEPDGDCVGSQLALRSALLRLNKEAVACSAGPFKRSGITDYSKHFTSIPTENKSEIKVIIVDCSTMERTGDIQKLLEEFPYAIIDHHDASTHPPSTLNAPVYIDPYSPSCTLLIEKLITALGLELTEEEASLLLFGLCTDTGFFRHLTEKNYAVFESAAKMIRHGANPKKSFQIMNGGKNLNSRILIGNILSRLESYFDGRLLLSYETLEEHNTFGQESRDSDSLNQLLFSIQGVEATAIIRQECDNNCSVSLRSADKIDVGQIAASLGGGGHKNASGFIIQESILSVKQIILKSFSGVFIC
jgi:phosphoesterase RecJ-like protein